MICINLSAWLCTLTAGTGFHLLSSDKEKKKAGGTAIDKSPGHESNFQLSYRMNNFSPVVAGYSVRNAAHGMALVKGQATTGAADHFKKTGHWFYVMIRSSPHFFNIKLTTNK